MSGPGFARLRDQVEAALEGLRPRLALDGGEVELLDVSPEGVVRVGLRGGCLLCPLSRLLLQRVLDECLRPLPLITKVVTVDV